MNIYRIWQETNGGYEMYDSAVVVAADEKDAQRMNPAARHGLPLYYNFDPAESWQDWTDQLSDVQVELLGTAREGDVPRVVIASFNAG